jgi:uncharacterized small protein (TIGR04563 family)
MDQKKRKQSIYVGVDILSEMHAEAQRQERSLSWIVQQAWKAAREQIMKNPGATP